MKPKSVPPTDVWALCGTSDCRRFSEHTRQHQTAGSLDVFAEEIFAKNRELVYSMCMPQAQVTQHEGLPAESSDGRFSKDNAALASTQQKQQSIFRCYPRHFSKGQQEHLIPKLMPCFKAKECILELVYLEKNIPLSLTLFLEGTGLL